MKYKIYQSYYKEEQKKFLNPEFTPFNNSSNKRPDLMEYYIFNIGYKKAVSERLSHWGFFSWKWEGKCKIKPQQFIDFIDKNPNQDIYLVNWAPYSEAIELNSWIHGECCMPGLIDIANKSLKKMNYMNYQIPSVENFLMDSKTYCFSSYFIGSKKFWSEYLVFLKKFKNTMDNDLELKSLIEQKVLYSGHKNYSFFPFLVERFFSTFLLLNEKKYSILNYPYDFSIYQKYIGDNYKEIEKCSKLKVKMFKSYKEGDIDMSRKYLKEWQLQKKKIVFPITIPDYHLHLK